MNAPEPELFWTPRFDVWADEQGNTMMRQVDPLPDSLPTIADYIDLWADRDPDRVWLARRVAGGGWAKVTYGAGRDQARRLGSALLALGLGPDRPLLILSENSLEHGVCSLACAYVGIPFAPVSPAYALRSSDYQKLRDIVALLNPGAVFADDVAAFTPAIEAVLPPQTPVIGVRALTPRAIDYAELLETDASAAAAARESLDRGTVLKYLFTSGSTGAPKAVINTNGMITANQAMVRDCYRFMQTEPPIILDWAPWNHTAAGNKVSYMVLTNGGTYYIDDGKPTPEGFATTLQNLREVACTYYFNVPAGYDRLVEALEADSALASVFFSRLRMLFYAGAGMSQQTWDRLDAAAKAATGKQMLIASSLGATETGPFALTWSELETAAGKVGVPGRGLTLKLVPLGDKLELRLKGPSLTPGYLGDPVATAKAFDEDGFYRMGDAVRPADPNDLSRGFYFDGRLAENFKLSTGTWVSVGAVSAALVDALATVIRDAVIVGEDQSELGALVWLSEAGSALGQAQLEAALTAGLLNHWESSTGSASCVRRISVLDQPPTFDTGELTEKGSINQRALRRSRADQVAALYADAAGTIRPIYPSN